METEMINTDVLTSYVDKYVTATYTDMIDGQRKTVDGKVTKANAVAVLIKPKGKGLLFIENENLHTIDLVTEPVKPTRLKVRYMDPIAIESVRQHLADRHGLPLGEVSADPAHAVLVHDGIQHEGLGHRHEPKPARASISETGAAERAAALDGAGGDGDQDEDCQHYGIECELPCPCDCNDCINNIDEEDTE
jgi:hypothetical protein